MRSEKAYEPEGGPLGLVASLRRRHHQLDERVAAEQKSPAPDSLRLRRLKSEKLGIKDRLAALGAA